MYPLTIPEKTKQILTDLGEVKDYDFSKPFLKPQPPEVSSWKAVTGILGDPKSFTVPWGPHTYDMTHHDYMLSGDKPVNVQQHAFIDNALYSPPKGMDEIANLYERVTVDLLKQKSRKLRSGYQLDVVAE